MVIRKIFTLAALTAAVTATSAFAQQYLGAELDTKESFMYGRFDARMYMAASSGLVSSMFLYYNNSWLGNDEGNNEPWEEIDIEVLGKSPGSFQSNIISGAKDLTDNNGNVIEKRKWTSEKYHNLNPAANAGYHTYSLIWTPEYVSWEIDGNEVRRDVRGVDKSKEGYEQVATLVHTESLRFNLWAAKDEGWVGKFNTGALPQHQYINWIKVYSYDTQSKQFSLKWKDDFDSFNSSRWTTGNWEMERVTYSPSNVNVKNGYLVLSLTEAGQEGAPNSVPADPNPELYDQDIGGTASSSSQGNNPVYSSSEANIVSNSSQGDAPESSSFQEDNPDALLVGMEYPFSLSMQKDGFVINGAMEGISWVVYDLNGMVLLKGSFPGKVNAQFVSTRNLPRGAYLLRVSRNGNSQTFRFVKP